jgi:hypothetical protein
VVLAAPPDTPSASVDLQETWETIAAARKQEVRMDWIDCFFMKLGNFRRWKVLWAGNKANFALPIT